MTKNKKGTAAGADGKGYRELIEIGIALSTERDHARLMERILAEAQRLSDADGGALYIRTEDNHLEFAIMRTASIGLAYGGTTGRAVPFGPLHLYDTESGEPNHHNVATHAALSGEVVNVADAYTARDFDFSGTKAFDKGTGYRSTSFLTVPLDDHAGKVIGVLQLLNAIDPVSGAVVPFADEIQPLIEALASQAAVALNNYNLIQAQRDLLDSFVRVVASTIDAKSSHTGGHCMRVPMLSELLAEAACASDAPPFRAFNLDEAGRRELQTAAWMHDSGKLTTPEHLVEKATKLETIYDRIHEIRLRFEVVKRDERIAYLKDRLEGRGDPEVLLEALDDRLAELDEQFAFVADCNIGGEEMTAEQIAHLRHIGCQRWTRTLDDRLGVGEEELRRKDRTAERPLPAEERLLDDKDEHLINWRPGEVVGNEHGFFREVPEYKYNLGELYNLSIPRGTLTPEERFKIDDHIVQTIVMLEKLPFPPDLARVPEYAGAHHERMDGTGHPRRLRGDEMSIPARIMIIADIFEALTAADRPYKKPLTLSQSIELMAGMSTSGHIDPDLFRLFLEAGIYRTYADHFMMPSQIDAVDVSRYLDG